MNKAQHDVQVKRIMALEQKWKNTLGLATWDFTHCFTRESVGETDNGWRGVAKADCKWEYLQAMFTWHTPAIADCDDRELEKHVIHELIHALVAELSLSKGGDARVHRERVVQSLANAILWTEQITRENCQEANAQTPTQPSP